MTTRADELKAKAAELKRRKEEAERKKGGSTKPAVVPVPAAVDVVTPEDRQRHLAPVAAPKAKPIRSTVDLSPVRHQQLKVWCGETAVMIGQTRVTTQDLFRTFVARLMTDETLAEKIRQDLRAGIE